MTHLGSLAGSVLDGKYRIDRLIGQGGMGAVYEARHLGTDRPVAVKVLLPDLVRNNEAIERFRREARAAGRLRHPNVVDVTDFGIATVEKNDVAYLVMEYLEGLSLRDAIDRRGFLPLDVVVDIAEQIAAALDEAHAAGIVHRDLKPDNVWLVHDGRGGFAVRVLDFGIARLGQEGAPPAAEAVLPEAEIAGDVTAVLSASDVDADATTDRLTTAGTLIGTPLYMSPEQCRGADVDSTTDIYSLGVVVYESLSGRRPFTGTLREVMRGHLKETPPPLAGVQPGVASVVTRALEKTPADRFRTASAFAGSLRAASEGPGVILRRSIALYAERFPEYFRISAHLAKVPVLITTVLLAFALIVALTPWPKLAVVPLMAAAFGSALLWTVVTMMSNASFAAAIERLRVKPLERLDARELPKEVRTRLGLPPDASYLRTLGTLFSYYLRCELRAPAGSGDLAFLIGFLEGVPLPDIPPRCALLAKGSSRAYTRVRAAIFGALFAVPLVETGILTLVLVLLQLPLGNKAPALAMTIAFSLIPLNAMLLNPVFSSALALVYYRARQAQGEDVVLSAVLPGRL